MRISQKIVELATKIAHHNSLEYADHVESMFPDSTVEIRVKYIRDTTIPDQRELERLALGIHHKTWKASDSEHKTFSFPCGVCERSFAIDPVTGSFLADCRCI